MMKYWNQLNELETAIYEVKTIQAGLNILCQTEEFTCYSPSGISQEHQTFVIDLNDRFDTAMEKLNERFQEVWNVVRDDTGFLGAAEEDDEEFTNEDIAAINDLVKDQEASIRFDQILSNLPTMNTQDNYIVAGAMDDTVSISDYSLDQLKLFDDEWNTMNHMNDIKLSTWQSGPTLTVSDDIDFTKINLSFSTQETSKT